MTGTAALVVSLMLLMVVLMAAVRAAREWVQAIVAVGAVAIIVVTGIVSPAASWHTASGMLGTVAFLACILAFAYLQGQEGVFDYLGAVAARRSEGDPRRLLRLVVMLAAGVTVVLTLDSTVVLLTPVVIATSARLRVASVPSVTACVELANAGSVLLPVSNLTNLLAFAVAGISFGKFAALMVIPWLVIVLSEWVILRRFFASSLGGTGTVSGVLPPRPTYALVVLALTTAGFVGLSALALPPALAALGGIAALISQQRERRRPRSLRSVLVAAKPGFVVFVLCLGIVVAGVSEHGGSRLLRAIVPTEPHLLGLLAIAFVAALAASLVNNIPATLMLLPIVAGSPLAVLAVLIGVNVGPNLSWAGSLATLLWRRLVPTTDRPSTAQFHLLGALSVVPIIALATGSLWLVGRALI